MTGPAPVDERREHAAAGGRRPVAASSLADSLVERGAGDAVRAAAVPLGLLLARHLRFDAADACWPDRDRLVLAAGAIAAGEQAVAMLGGTGPGLFETASQPFAAAVGLAMAERQMAARFGRSLVDHRTWLLCGPAEIEDAASYASAAMAGSARLSRLAVLACLPAGSPPPAALPAFAALGWSVRRAGLADPDDVEGAITAATRAAKPTLVACLASCSERVLAGQEVGETAEDGPWEMTARSGAGRRRSWLKRLARHGTRRDFEQALSGRPGLGWLAPLAMPAWLGSASGPCSTLGALRQGWADLLATLPGLPALEPGEAAPGTLAGLALHGGVLPVACQPLASADRLQPALGDAARRGSRAVAVLVEPTIPCPVGGQRAGLRAMGNVAVFRPADASETVECLELALRRLSGPSVVLVSDQPVARLSDRPARTRSARGGYLAAGDGGGRDVTLVASGADLHVALATRALLAESGVAACVVSLPCWDLFAAQEQGWRDHVLGSAPRVGAEAGSGFGWERWLGEAGLFVDLAAAAGSASNLCTSVLRHLGKPSFFEKKYQETPVH